MPIPSESLLQEEGAPAEQRARNAEAEAGDGPVPVFDRSCLLEILGDEEELIGQVLERYLGFVRSYLDLLATALFSADIQQAQLLAHAIKGATINIGALQVSEAAGRLEARAKRGDLEGAVGLFDELLTSVDNFRLKVAPPQAP